jgi:hypothetical protein
METTTAITIPVLLVTTESDSGQQSGDARAPRVPIISARISAYTAGENLAPQTIATDFSASTVASAVLRSAAATGECTRRESGSG